MRSVMTFLCWLPWRLSFGFGLLECARAVAATWPQRVRSVAALAFMLPMLAWQNAAYAACDAARTVPQALRLVENVGAPAAQAVDLPDHLPLALRQPAASLRYRIDVSSCAGVGGVFIYRVGAPYRLWLLHGAAGAQRTRAWLPQTGQRDALLARLGPTVYNGRVPVAVAIPANAHTLEIELASLPYIPSGLVGVELGPDLSVASAQARAFDSLSSGSDLVAGISVFIGLVAVLLSTRRRHDIGLRWFALGCVVWGLRNLLYLNTELPRSGYAAELFLSQAVAVCGLCMSASALYASGHASVAWQRWFALSLLVILGGLGCSVIWPALAMPVRLASFLITVGTLLGTAWRLCTLPPQAHGVPRLLQVLLGLAFVTQVLLGGHDFGIVLGLRAPDAPALAFWGFSALVMAMAMLSGSRVVAALGRAENSNAELERRVAEKNEALQRSYAAARENELLAERHMARSQERERLNREMHDGLGAQLITALRGIERGALNKDQVAHVLQEGLDELRLLMDTSDLGRHLHGALVAWRNRWDARLAALGMELHWQLDPALEALDLGSDAHLHIMRLLQEATANAVKHAQANNLHVHTHLHEGGLHMEVTDDGRGFTPSGGSPMGRGLKNMHQRAAQLQAHLQVHSPAAAGRGTRVFLRVPVPPLTPQPPA
jgi:signal transduction histidine kinase